MTNQTNAKKVKKLSGARLVLFKSAFDSAPFSFKIQKSRCDTHVDSGWYYYTFEGIASSTHNGHKVEICFRSFIDYCSRTDALLSCDSQLHTVIDGTEYLICDAYLRQLVARFINNVCIENRLLGE